MQVLLNFEKLKLLLYGRITGLIFNSAIRRRLVLVLTIFILSAVAFHFVSKLHFSVWNRNFAEEFKKYSRIHGEPSNLLSHLSYSGDNKDHTVELLSGNLVPNVVFYVWCGSRPFEFSHYLSVLSVLRHIRPDKIIFYYDSYPQIDDNLYNTWFLELLDSVPYFIAEEIRIVDACKSERQANKAYIKNLVVDEGGIYVNESTILNSFPFSCRQSNDTTFYNSDGSLSVFNSKPRNRRKVSNHNTETQVQSSACKMTCITRAAAEKNADANSIPCVHLLNRIYPKDIWMLENSFGRLVRTLFYGSPEKRQANPSKGPLAPNIAHMVWLGGGSMDFLFYLGALSLIYVAKVDMLYIHGDSPPKGEYWNLVANNEKIKHVYRSASTIIYGNHVGWKKHKSDVWRVDIMLNYGGLYVDTDAIFVKPLDEKIRSYDAVAAYDWSQSAPFPNIINFGVTVGKRNALFWRKFQSTMKWFIDGDFLWNGLRQPYRVFERNPELLKIDSRLQVLCYEDMCRPTWHPNHTNFYIHHMNSGSIKNWREDTNAFHWTYPNPWELKDHKTLFSLKKDTMFAEIAKFVLKEAGMFDYFRNLVL